MSIFPITANLTITQHFSHVGCHVGKKTTSLKTSGENLEYIELVVRDFEKVIGRKDIKYPQFFAMPNEILEHPDFFDITGDEFKAYTWILGVASKLRNPKVRIYPDLCERRTTVKRKTVELTIQKLNGKRWDVQMPYGSRTDAEQNPCIELNRIELNCIELNRTEGGARTAFVHPKTFDEFLELFNHKLQSHWLELYSNDKDWILRSLKECYGYFYIAKTKKPSASFDGWASRASGWLKRGWEKDSKSSTAQPKIKLDSLVKSPENVAWANSFSDEKPPQLKDAK